MDTLSLINSNPEFKQIESDHLFYDQFQYKFGFYLQELPCLRDLNNDPEKDRKKIAWNLSQRKKWSENRRSISWGGNWNSRMQGEPIGDDVEPNLLAFYDFYINDPDSKKLVIISGGYGYLYTNNKNHFYSLKSLPFIGHVACTRVSVVLPKNTIKLKNPKFPKRLYFRDKRVTHQQKVFLTNFLKNHEQNIRLGPALKDWLTKPDYHYLFGNFFIEYEHDSFVDLLGLVCPSVVRKTVSVIKV